MANPESDKDHERVTPILASDNIVASSSGSEAVSQDEEDDGQALLPRHTKVRVTGNNRTKQSLVGLTGVVKKAVGLGGWHWLVSSYLLQRCTHCTVQACRLRLVFGVQHVNLSLAFRC